MLVIRESVGRGGANRPEDVAIIQRLLVQNQRHLIPAQMPNNTGFCDAQTIYLIEQFQNRVMGLQNPTGLVEPDSATLFALNGQSGPAGAIDPVLAESLRGLHSTAYNFAARFIRDSAVRSDYILEAERMAQNLLEKVARGELAPHAAADQANAMRNGIMDAARLRNSDIGRAVSELEKAAGLTLAQLKERYAQRLFRRSFAQLSNAEKNQVFVEVVTAAGRTNTRFNQWASRLGRAGRGLIVLSIAISVYNIATADDPAEAAGREVVVTGAGFGGSLLGGAVAGLACGPGAPICVGVGVLVGGILFAVGADLGYDWAIQ